MRYTIFSGCLINTRFPEYEKSARLVLDGLGLEFKFIDNFSCCGSQIMESIDEEKLLRIASRNLALAEQEEIDVILTLCGSCTYILKKTQIELQNENKRRKINQILSKIKLQYSNTIQIKHLAELLNENRIFQKLKARLKTKINLTLAVQNPCMLYRPERISKINKDENSLISHLLKQSGAQIVCQEFQDQCCEGTMLAFNESVGELLIKQRYEAINKLKIDLFVVGCPNCQLVYSIYPTIFNATLVPSVFFTQILGLSQGYSFDDLALYRNLEYEKIKVILKSKGILDR